LPCRHKIDAVDDPIPIGVGRDICSLKRVRAQIVYFGNAEFRERVAPDQQRSRLTLLLEHELPALEPQRNQITVVIEVDEFLPRAVGLLPGQVGELIIAIEMDLEGSPRGGIAGEELVLDAGITCSRKQRREPVETAEDLVRHLARLDA